MLRVALVVSAAATVFLLALGAGARWELWWAVTVALYIIGMAGGWTAPLGLGSLGGESSRRRRRIAGAGRAGQS